MVDQVVDAESARDRIGEDARRERAKPALVLARGPRPFRRRDHERADAAARFEDPGSFELGVHARHGIGVDAQVHGQLPDGRQLVAHAEPAGEARVDGEWKMVMQTPMGPQEMTGLFRTDGEALSGELVSPEGSQGFTGTVAGNQLKFNLAVEKPMKMTLKYAITVDGDQLNGKVKLGMFGSATLTGERVG